MYVCSGGLEFWCQESAYPHLHRSRNVEGLGIWDPRFGSAGMGALNPKTLNPPAKRHPEIRAGRSWRARSRWTLLPFQKRQPSQMWYPIPEVSSHPRRGTRPRRSSAVELAP